MNNRVRVTVLVSPAEKMGMEASLDKDDGENFQRFVRKAIREELKRRGETHTSAARAVEVSNTSLRAEVQHPLVREGEPFPRRSDMVRDPNDGIPDFLRRNP